MCLPKLYFSALKLSDDLSNKNYKGYTETSLKETKMSHF